MWERKRGSLELHTKSLKSSEALGAVMCRAVNWSWHSTVEKRSQNVQACQSHKRWGSGCRAREKGNTHRPHHFYIFTEKRQRSLSVGVFILICAFTYAKMPQYLPTCAILWQLQHHVLTSLSLPVKFGFRAQTYAQNQIDALWNHPFCYIF